VKALSSDSRIADSEMSNILTLNEPLADGSYGMVGGLRNLEMLAGQGGPLAAFLGDETDADDGFPVHVIRLTDSAIHLDWSQYQPPSSLVYYRVVWSSASNPAVSFTVQPWPNKRLHEYPDPLCTLDDNLKL
jgi:hypothetical protein